MVCVMKIGIYARVSTKKQSEQEQIPAIIKGFNLIESDCIIFKEEVSAWSIEKESKRLELLKLKDSIHNKEISKLYIWDLDRLFRNRKKTKEFFNMCAFYGVTIYSLNQKWLNDFQALKDQFPENFKFLIDNMSNLLLDVYTQSAEDESTKKSERVKLKVKHCDDGITRSKNGKKWGRRKLPKRVSDDVLQFHNEKKSIRWIAANVFYYDKNNNKRNLSVGTVHQIITSVQKTILEKE